MIYTLPTITKDWGFCSDPHAYHTNIIEYGNRPFGSALEMNGAMIARWNRIISETGNVLCLGDLVFISGKKWEEWQRRNVREYLSALNGTIWLVPGNHDELLVEMYKEGDPVVISKVRLLEPYVETKIGTMSAVLCHYPLERWHHMNTAVHLHGHTHPTSQDGKIVDPFGGLGNKRNRLNLCADVLAQGYGIDTYAPIGWATLHRLLTQVNQPMCQAAPPAGYCGGTSNSTCVTAPVSSIVRSTSDAE